MSSTPSTVFKRKKTNPEYSSSEDESWVDEYGHYLQSSYQTRSNGSTTSGPASPIAPSPIPAPSGHPHALSPQPGLYPGFTDPTEPTRLSGVHRPVPPTPNAEAIARAEAHRRRPQEQAAGPFIGRQDGLYAHDLHPHNQSYHPPHAETRRFPPVPKASPVAGYHPHRPWQQRQTAEGSPAVQRAVRDLRPKDRRVQQGEQPAHGPRHGPVQDHRPGQGPSGSPSAGPSHPPPSLGAGSPTPSATPASQASPDGSSPGAVSMTQFQHRHGDGSWSCRYPGCNRQHVRCRYQDLKKHQRWHEEKLFHCPESGCDKAFRFEGHLQTHVDSMHLKVRYYCQVPGCVHDESRHDNLISEKRHYGRKHPGVEPPSKEEAARMPPWYPRAPQQPAGSPMSAARTSMANSPMSSMSSPLVGMRPPQLPTTPSAPRPLPDPRWMNTGAVQAPSLPTPYQRSPVPAYHQPFDQSAIDPQLRNWPALPTQQQQPGNPCFQSADIRASQRETPANAMSSGSLLTPPLSRGSSFSRSSRAREQSFSRSTRRPSVGMMSPPTTPMPNRYSQHASLYSHVAAGLTIPTPPATETTSSRRSSNAGYAHGRDLVYRPKKAVEAPEYGFGSASHQAG